jgi:(1->4)-alpha-D-glucan 1-alpha-D-glucosylmutase
LLQELLSSKEDGRMKLYVTSLALHCRRSHPGLFATGDYFPAPTLGAKRTHVFGFVRRQGNYGAIVILPRLLVQLLSDGQEAPVGERVWQDTKMLVPGVELQWSWRNVFTGEPVTFTREDGQPLLAVAEVLAHFPVALLIAAEEGR